jgi:hypothetical protein
MATKINQPATGLQSLLGTQAFGDNPNLLDQLASPVVDLLPFLGQQLLTSQRIAADVVGIGPGASATVPAGEAWIPVHASAKVNYNILDGGAAVHLYYTLRVRLNAITAGVPFVVVASLDTIIQQVVAGLTGGHGIEWNPPQRTIFGPGSIFQVVVDDKDSVNSSPTDLNIIYYKLAI